MLKRVLNHFIFCRTRAQPRHGFSYCHHFKKHSANQNSFGMTVAVGQNASFPCPRALCCRPRDLFCPCDGGTKACGSAAAASCRFVPAHHVFLRESDGSGVHVAQRASVHTTDSKYKVLPACGHSSVRRNECSGSAISKIVKARSKLSAENLRYSVSTMSPAAC